MNARQSEQLLEAVVVATGVAHCAEGRDAGDTWLAAQQRQLAEDGPWPADRQAPLAIAGPADDIDRAGEDDDEPVDQLALMEHDLAGGDLVGLEPAGEVPQRVRIDLTEQLEAAQFRCFDHGPSVWSAPRPLGRATCHRPGGSGGPGAWPTTRVTVYPQGYEHSTPERLRHARRHPARRLW